MPMHLTVEKDSELFDELSSLIPSVGTNAFVLYRPVFVRLLLKDRNFSSLNVFRALDEAQEASGGDPYYIDRWFTEDNDVILSIRYLVKTN